MQKLARFIVMRACHGFIICNAHGASSHSCLASYTDSFWLFRSSWPAAYWDDWMRLSSVRQGRQCIRPEICRTYNFGEQGSSHGQYYERYLRPIKLNDVAVDWREQDLDYLDPIRYAEDINKTVSSATLLLSADDINSAEGLVKLLYGSRQEYAKIAAAIGILGDWKDGIPRASCKGIVRTQMGRYSGDQLKFFGEFLLVPASQADRQIPD